MRRLLVAAWAITALFAIVCVASTFAAVWTSGDLQSRLVNQAFVTFFLTVIGCALSSVFQSELS